MRRSILLLPLVIAACATTGSSGGKIDIETAARGQAVAGANCMVTLGSASWNVVTPAAIEVGNAGGDLRVVCNKQGYRTSETIFRPSNPYGSNVGLGVGGGGGNVGVGVGLNFPIRFGGGAYPSRVTVEMNPQ